MKAGDGALKRRPQTFHDMKGFAGEIRARCQPRRLPQFGAQEDEDEIGSVEDQKFFRIFLFQRLFASGF